MENTVLFNLTHKYLRWAYERFLQEIVEYHNTNNDQDIQNLCGWLRGQLNRGQETLKDQGINLKTLIDLAGDLQKAISIWTLYETAWTQRAKLSATLAPENRSFSRKAIAISDTLVHKLYESIGTLGSDRLNRLDIPGSNLIVVPALNRLSAGGFGTPAPYIITPRWGHTQPWHWLSYAHEVGHHIYRNIEGLSEELKVKVALSLAAKGREYTILNLWYQWLEEIFADLFGLLQIGPAYVRSQQVSFLLNLPARSKARPDYDPRHNLLVARDFEHPISHIRAYLALTGLELMETRSEILDPLWDRWRTFIEVTIPAPENVYARIRNIEFAGDTFTRKTDPQKPISVKLLQDIGRQVLEIILNTPLDALLDETGQPQTIKTVFSRPLPQNYAIEQATRMLLASSAINDLPNDEIKDIRNILAVVINVFEQAENDTTLTQLNRNFVDHYYALTDAQLGAPITTRSIIYSVKLGEKITEIAEKFYHDKAKYEVIKWANNLETAQNLEAGQSLIIPFFE